MNECVGQFDKYEKCNASGCDDESYNACKVETVYLLRQNVYDITAEHDRLRDELLKIADSSYCVHTGCVATATAEDCRKCSTDSAISAIIRKGC